LRIRAEATAGTIATATSGGRKMRRAEKRGHDEEYLFREMSQEGELN